MTSLVDRALVLLAVLIALPTLLGDLYAVVALPRGRSGATHPLARLFRWLDVRTHFLMSPASYLCLDYLFLRLGWAVVGSSLSALAKLSSLLALACLAAALMYPLLALYNLVASLFWRNPPLDLDKRAYFPSSALLEHPRIFQGIRRELLALLAEERAVPITDIYQNLTITRTDADAPPTPEGAATRGWRSFFLRVADRDIDENLARVPTLAAALRQMPEVYNALFSILDPGHGIAPHRGYFKGILRYHLGVLVPSPEEAWLICGGAHHHWREGDGVLFDDLFVHSVENRCTSARVVLYLDVRRPAAGLSKPFSEALFWLVTHHPYHRGVRARAAGR